MMLHFNDYFDLSLSHTGYTEPMEQLQDVLSLIKLYLASYEQLSDTLNHTNKKTVDSSHQLSVLNEAWEHLLQREEATTIFLPLTYLKSTLNLSFFEYLSLLLAISVELDQNVGTICHQYCPQYQSQPTFYLAFCLYGITEPINFELFREAYLTHSNLQYLLHYDVSTYHNEPLMNYPLCLRKSVMLYLTYTSFTQQECFYHLKPEPQPPVYAPIHNSIVAKLTDYFECLSDYSTSFLRLIIIEGPKGVGKRTVLKRVAHTFDASILFFDIEKLATMETAYQKNLINDLYLYTLLNHHLVCLVNCNEETNKVLYEPILHKLGSLIDHIFLTFNKPLTNSISINQAQVLDLSIKTHSPADQYAIWSYLKEKYVLPIDAKAYAGKYHLTIGSLEQIINNCELIASYQHCSSLSEELLIKSILATNKLTSNTYVVHHPFTFDDLILDEKTFAQLQYISNYVKNRHIIFEDWGFSNKLPYGKGVNILFYGSPGTGKTMCASVLANEWGLDLVKVDLSQIIDKYIGETEKRLDAIFENAGQNNCVLFFDEADSLFSKRTEIQSSNDKYANVEVSHLLQKIECYDGIVILATNLVQNFDEAFKRRIHFMLHFTLPNASIRKTLWQKAFPVEAPLADDIDFEFLGEKYDLSPSNIKSTSLYAAFLAQASHSSINMTYITQAIRHEYERNGRILPC